MSAIENVLKTTTLEDGDLNLLTEEEKWSAVVTRNRFSDGRFVFAVRSTGIYCNPSCPAKRPRRAQVLFFLSPKEAELSGFRPCRRCRPNQNTRSPQIATIDRLCAYIMNNLDKKLTLTILSAQVGLSPYYLQRIFKRIVGVSPRQYIETLRLAKMKQSLLRGETVTRAIYSAGFSSRSRFYENGSHKLGMSPGVLRRGGAGMRISYTIIGSPLGRLLVARTEFGICAVCFGDSDEKVKTALSEQYPSADLQRNDEVLAESVSKIAKYFAREEPNLDLPLDLQATTFQRRVWAEIRSIPYGGTTTYSKIAGALGQPQAARAVARACATNPVALVVPCHRVIGEDGELRGYRWGKERKQQLLQLEQRNNR